MFRITQDPSSGSDNLFLTEITYNSVVLIMCVFGLWRDIVDLWCVCVCVCVRALRRAENYKHIFASAEILSIIIPFCNLYIFIVRVCIVIFVYVLLLLSIYSYICLCILIVVYVFLLFVHVFLL